MHVLPRLGAGKGKLLALSAQRGERVIKGENNSLLVESGVQRDLAVLANTVRRSEGTTRREKGMGSSTLEEIRGGDGVSWLQTASELRIGVGPRLTQTGDTSQKCPGQMGKWALKESPAISNQTREKEGSFPQRNPAREGSY